MLDLKLFILAIYSIIHIYPIVSTTQKIVILVYVNLGKRKKSWQVGGRESAAHISICLLSIILLYMYAMGIFQN